MSERIIRDTMIRPGPVGATGGTGPPADTSTLVTRASVVRKPLLADTMLTSTTNAFVPDLIVPMAANEKWLVDFWFYAYSSIPAGAKFGLIGPAGTTLKAHVFGSLASRSSMGYSPLDANSALSGAAFGTLVDAAWIKIEGTVTCGGTAGNLSVIGALAAAAASGQSVILYAGSKLRAERVV